MKISLSIVLFIYSQAILADCPTVSKEIESLIKEHSSKVKGGEYCKYRKTYQEQNIELALYTIEGPCYKNEYPTGSCGNHYFISMVGIINKQKYSPIVIGGKGLFHSKSIKYKDNIIHISGLAYKKTDPMCCPSLKEERLYKVKDTEFEQIQP